MNAEQKRILKQAGIDLVTWEQGKHRARELVVESAAADRRQSLVQWAWADLCIEVVPDKARAGGQDGRMVCALLDMWSTEYEFPYSRGTLTQMRVNARAWPKDRRSSASYSTHSVLAASPERFSIITDSMSFSEARAAMGRKPRAGNPRAASSPIECANAAKSFSRRLAKIVPDRPSEDVLESIHEVWLELTVLMDRFGRLEDAIDVYEQFDALEMVA